MTERVIPADAVQAIGRFRPDGPIGYRAREPYASNSPVRATRVEALADIGKADPPCCPHLDGCEFCTRAPWSCEDEMWRRGYIAAGLEPRRAHWWTSSTTESLEASYDEYTREGIEPEVCAELLVEIRYRTDHLRGA